MIHITAATRAFLFEAAAGGDIDFATNDRLDPLVSGSLIKIDCAVENAMIGNRERRKLQFMRLLQQSIQTTGAIEQRVLGVEMEMNKIRVRHATNLMPGDRARQAERTAIFFTENREEPLMVRLKHE